MKKERGGGCCYPTEREREEEERRGERARGVIGGWCARDAQAELHNQRSGGVPKSRTASARPPDCRLQVDIICCAATLLAGFLRASQVNSGVCRLDLEDMRRCTALLLLFVVSLHFLSAEGEIFLHFWGV